MFADRLFSLTVKFFLILRSWNEFVCFILIFPFLPCMGSSEASPVFSGISRERGSSKDMGIFCLQPHHPRSTARKPRLSGAIWFLPFVEEGHEVAEGCWENIFEKYLDFLYKMFIILTVAKGRERNTPVDRKKSKFKKMKKRQIKNKGRPLFSGSQKNQNN